jgi:hypothetical protein
LNAFLKLIPAVFLFMMLGACGGQGAYVLGPKWLDDLEVAVEIRPGAPTAGMNEFLVIVTHRDRKPGHQYIVSIKMDHQSEWRQSIQDGATGVFRRAVRVDDPVNDVLLVKLEAKRSNAEVGQLEFPLSQPTQK